MASRRDSLPIMKNTFVLVRDGRFDGRLSRIVGQPALLTPEFMLPASRSNLMKVLFRVVVLTGLAGAGGAAVWYGMIRPANLPSDTLTVFGNVDVRQIELAINGSERIGRVLVEEGDLLEPGQLIAELEQERFTLSVDRAEALIQTQKQVVARLEAGTRPEEIREAEAAAEAVRAELADAESTFKRVQALMDKNATTQQSVDDARSKRDVAAANVRLRTASLELARAGPRKEDIAEAKAVLKRLEVELAQARHDLHDASLHAPSRCIVQERILEAGDMASPQKPVYTVALTDPVWVRAYVSEPDLGKVFEGMTAKVVTDSFPGKEYDGWVGFISPSAEFTPKPVETRELRTKLVYQIRVFVNNPNNELRLGMPATVNIPLGQSRSHSSGSHSPSSRSPSSHSPGEQGGAGRAGSGVSPASGASPAGTKPE